MNDAIISADGLYRYQLTRDLRSNRSHGRGRIAWIMFNPSVAGKTINDSTIRKVIGFSCRWDYDIADVYNMFGYRSTRAANLWKVADPIGPENDDYLRAIPLDIPIVAAWGAIPINARFCDRIGKVKEILAGRHVQCLGKCNDGRPRHPLMLAYNTPLEDYWLGAR